MKREIEDEVQEQKQLKTAKDSYATNIEQEIDEMGEFEDLWDDEAESEEILVEQDSDQDNVMQLDDEDEEAVEAKTYLPGQEIEQDQVLVPDNSAYECLHRLNVEWPCLSFDILSDKLGENRKDFPHTCYLVAGSQAEKAKDNKIYLMKMSRLHKTKHDDDDEDMQESDDENDFDEDACLEYKSIQHNGGINRIRVMPHAENHIVATWSELGKVNIYDLTKHYESLNVPGMTVSSNLKPIYTNNRHRNEGYALDWSRDSKLLSGDCSTKIYQTIPNGSSFTTEEQPFHGHTKSVEDLQWSPSEKTVFASCSVDKTIKIWDTRTRKKAQLSILAHETDVNVISWNRSVDHLLASGADDGVFSVWDLRTWVSAEKQTPAATFKWHQGAISSLEWHPNESSVLAVAGADNQLTLWDLALEADPEEQVVQAGNDQLVIPPQLLFIHQGQTNVKELHMHRQIPGLVISTAFDGFHVFKTINS